MVETGGWTPVGGRDFPRNWHEFGQFFPDEKACLRYLAKLRWAEGFDCPACGHDRYWLRGDGLFLCAACRHKTSATAGTIFDKTRTPLTSWFAAAWYLTNQTQGASALGLQRVLGLGSYETAWTMLHKFRRAMEPTSGLLKGRVEVDECYVGGVEPGSRGRQTKTKSKVVIAVEQRGPRQAAGRVRMRRIEAASSAVLLGFIEDTIEPGSAVVTDAWNAYTALATRDFTHEAHNVSGTGVRAHEVLPAVHRVTSLLKRWLLGTHQGSVRPEQLDYYLAEFCFRFNRRRSGSRGLLFHNLILQAAATAPKPYLDLIAPDKAEARQKKLARAKAKRDRGKGGDPLNVSRRNPKRPGGPRTTLDGSPTNKRRFVVGGRRG